MAPLPPPPDLTQVCFKDVGFLQHVGLFPHTALDYFAASQFYDKGCINEQVKMQARFNALRAGEMNTTGMTGAEYRVGMPAGPQVYTIEKHYRYSPKRTELIGMYYIIDGTIYQAPDLSRVLASRTVT
ncbi:hypothetical protein CAUPRSCDRAFT_9380 [Caulochytrium protostelioides]|uniref:Mediator of RNA polymerase II transcription subunit 6 n=1 Tax=Caulochytrium protostelioides TaxID=1555241 RepID=A0A4V1ISX8_9FUNG|nr:hypothetical protein CAUPRSCDRAFT_9380 [Caulochytrium protostelioides]